jgi:hypothetical protein
MKRFFRWSILGLSAAGVILAAIFGPGRIYGLLNSRQVDGQVVKIQPLDADDENNTAGYLIKLQESSGEEHIFATSDGRWMMIKNNDWVRANLYPAPPWSAGRGQWQNAGLAAAWQQSLRRRSRRKFSEKTTSPLCSLKPLPLHQSPHRLSRLGQTRMYDIPRRRPIPPRRKRKHRRIRKSRKQPPMAKAFKKPIKHCRSNAPSRKRLANKIANARAAFGDAGK